MQKLMVSQLLVSVLGSLSLTALLVGVATAAAV